jgi:flavin-dependent dehydrogenase
MNAAVDCIVLGGGPAGSTFAALVAKAGFRTLLVERQRTPRAPRGESLLPECHPLLEQLGVIDGLRASRFPHKYGVELIAATGQPAHKFSFRDRHSSAAAQTWQVLRGEFDEMLARSASERGAVVRTGTRAVEVLFDGPRTTAVRLVASQGQIEIVPARLVVDATGGQSFLAERLGQAEPVPTAQQRVAVWAHYENAHRAGGTDAGSTLFLRTKDRRAWFWFIPLPDNMASIGVVGSHAHLFPGRGAPESAFEEQLVNCPAVVERLADARLAGPFHVSRGFAGSARQAAGDGWMLVGDALAGGDPLFSTGILFALRSGELAAATAIDALASGDLAAGRLSSTAELLAQERQPLARLVTGFSTEGFCPFEFLAEHPQHLGPLADLVAGRVFGPAGSGVFGPAGDGPCEPALGVGPLLDDLDEWLIRHHFVAKPQQTLR